MLIMYGDYRDLNFAGDYERSCPAEWYKHEIEEFRGVWKKFINGELNLKRNPTQEEWERAMWIDISHKVFDTNEYTVYSIIGPEKSRPDLNNVNKWVDKENNVCVTETKQKTILPFEVVKAREIEWNMKEEERVAPWIREHYPHLPELDIYTSAIERWQNKKESRWFW